MDGTSSLEGLSGVVEDQGLTTIDRLENSAQRVDRDFSQPRQSQTFRTSGLAGTPWISGPGGQRMSTGAGGLATST